MYNIPHQSLYVHTAVLNEWKRGTFDLCRYILRLHSLCRSFGLARVGLPTEEGLEKSSAVLDACWLLYTVVYVLLGASANGIWPLLDAQSERWFCRAITFVLSSRTWHVLTVTTSYGTVHAGGEVFKTY